MSSETAFTQTWSEIAKDFELHARGGWWSIFAAREQIPGYPRVKCDDVLVDELSDPSKWDQPPGEGTTGDTRLLAEYGAHVRAFGLVLACSSFATANPALFRISSIGFHKI